MSLKPKSKSVSGEQIEHQRLTSLINSMADAVIAVDENIKVVLYNAAALNLLDVNMIKKGKRLSEILKPFDKDNQPQEIDKIVKAVTLPTTSRDLLLEYPDGSIINLYTSIAPVHLGYGQQIKSGFVVLLRDITREKSLEEERDEFISVVSHELRTPIAIAEGNISNALLSVERTGNVATVKQALDQAHDQVLFLSDMINDLSTLSRAETGKLELSVEKINVHDLINDLAKIYQEQANIKHLKLKSEIDPKLELLSSSSLYLREILQNFITNAIKYTSKGSVTIKAKATPKGVRFVVVDTGIGISKPDQEKVFDKFFRSEDYRTRVANGTGLGLYVTVKLARLIHAEIELKSELNRGSTFTIFVPNLD